MLLIHSIFVVVFVLFVTKLTSSAVLRIEVSPV